MKINSEKLWDYINNLATDEKVRFKVYYDDIYTTEILWNGGNFEWESGRFTSEAFFSPLYDFEPIEKGIEKLPHSIMFTTVLGSQALELAEKISENRIKINELIDEINKLKELNK